MAGRATCRSTCRLVTGHGLCSGVSGATAAARSGCLQHGPGVLPRQRLTGRLRRRLEWSASRSGRALSAAEYGGVVVQRALVAGWSRRRLPVRMRGLDETCTRSLR